MAVSLGVRRTLAAFLLASGCDGGDASPGVGTEGTGSAAETTATSSSTTSAATSGDATSTTGVATAGHGSGTTGTTGTTGEGTGEATETGSTTGGVCSLGSEGCACDEGTCEGALVCTEGTCLPAGACAAQIDAEPNDDDASAVDLGERTCGMNIGFTGSVDASGADWFAASAVGTPCSPGVASGVRVVAPQALDVCVYFDCDSSSATSYGCNAGSVQAMSPAGHPGCCGGSAPEMTNISCPGAGNSGNAGTIFIEVRPTATCTEYEIGAQFH